MLFKLYNDEVIKYKSKIDPDNLEKIINLSIWKNIPNTNNLFNAYESKKNFLLKKPIAVKSNISSKVFSCKLIKRIRMEEFIQEIF
jgi:hypothetical protein